MGRPLRKHLTAGIGLGILLVLLVRSRPAHGEQLRKLVRRKTVEARKHGDNHAGR